MVQEPSARDDKLTETLTLPGSLFDYMGTTSAWRMLDLRSRLACADGRSGLAGLESTTTHDKEEPEVSAESFDD